MNIILFVIFTIGNCLYVTNGSKHEESNTKFAAYCYREVTKQTTNNVLFSPFSAQLTLSLMTIGAAGNTAKELIGAVGVPTGRSVTKYTIEDILNAVENVETYVLRTTSKIYVNDKVSINKSYKDIAKYSFHSDIENIDVTNTQKAVDKINNWVQTETRQKIDNIVNEQNVNPETSAIFLNALYLNTNWLHGFKIEKMGYFYINERTKKSVDFMIKVDTVNYYNSQILQAKFLELPFLIPGVSMIFVLPHEIDGLSTLEFSMDRIFNIDFNKTLVKYVIPKFTIQSTIDIKSILKSKGVQQAFTQFANFRKITNNPLFISDVIQKVLIDVNENGDSAQTATSSDFVEDFIANRPFMFYIKHELLGILLMGKVITVDENK